MVSSKRVSSHSSESSEVVLKEGRVADACRWAGAAIMKKHTYGPDNRHFTSSSLLIVFNRVFSVCVGLAILFYKVSTRFRTECGVVWSAVGRFSADRAWFILMMRT